MKLFYTPVERLLLTIHDPSTVALNKFLWDRAWDIWCALDDKCGPWGRNNSAHEQRSTARGSPQRTPANLRCVRCVNGVSGTIINLTHFFCLYFKHLTQGVSGVSGVSAFSSSLSGFSKQVFFFIN